MKKIKRGRPKTKGTKLKGGTTTIKLKCLICGKKRKINTTSPLLYTKTVKDNYVCLMCKSKGCGK